MKRNKFANPELETGDDLLLRRALAEQSMMRGEMLEALKRHEFECWQEQWIRNIETPISANR